MLVRDIMRSPVVAVPPETTLEDAYRTMREKAFRHLPVLDGGRLVGVVTDRDLRLATSALAPVPFPAGSSVAAVMCREPLTASAEDAVEDAARVMRERKIGCLPVVDDGRVVGIITGIDLLDALIRMTGVDKPSGRLEVRLEVVDVVLVHPGSGHGFDALPCPVVEAGRDQAASSSAFTRTSPVRSTDIKAALMSRRPSRQRRSLSIRPSSEE